MDEYSFQLVIRRCFYPLFSNVPACFDSTCLFGGGGEVMLILQSKFVKKAIIQIEGGDQKNLVSTMRRK